MMPASACWHYAVLHGSFWCRTTAAAYLYSLGEWPAYTEVLHCAAARLTHAACRLPM